MSNKNTYMAGAVHHDNSRHVEINLQSLSADALGEMVCSFLNNGIDGGQASAASGADAAGTTAAGEEASRRLTLEHQVAKVVDMLRSENLLSKPSDFTWVMWGIQYAEGRELFKNAPAYIGFLNECRIENIPSDDTIHRYNKGFKLSCRPDEIQFQDNVLGVKRNSRIAIIKRTMVLMREIKAEK